MTSEQYNTLQAREAEAWAAYTAQSHALDCQVNIAREAYNQAVAERFESLELKRLGQQWQEQYAKLRQAEAAIIAQNEMAML